MKLLKDGADTGISTTASAPGWNWSFTGLAKYEGGELVSYGVEEGEVAGYTSTVEKKEDGTYTITNSHETEKTSVSVRKEWDDAKDQDGKRPESVTVHLTKNGKEVETVALDGENGWQHTWDGLEKYEEGIEITYGVTEDAVKDYSTSISGSMESGYVVKNSYTPGETSVSVEKIWSDSENQDGKRPESIQVQLKADSVKRGETVTLDAAGGWKHTWENLPEKSGGKTISYTVEEVSVPEGYEVSYSGQGTSKITITNSHEAEKTEISGTKTWIDADDQDGLRPDSIIIRLYANDTEIRHQEVSQATGWTWKFTDLDRYEDGKLINYRITEDVVTGYTSVITGTSRVVNTHVPEKITVSGTKTWVDNNNENGARPAQIVIQLLANNKPVEGKSVTVTVNENWSWSFTDLPKYEEGKEIIYTVSEEEVRDYTATVNGMNVTNTYDPEKTQVTVTKQWVEENGYTGIRPAEITVQLYEDRLFDKKVGNPVVLNAGNNWTYTWNDLPKRKFLGDVNYTVKEVGDVTGYITGKPIENTTNNIVITNTLETVKVEGSKTWMDHDSPDRPAEITINLMDGMNIVDTVTVTEFSGWKWSFDGLPKYKKGTDGAIVEVKYSIEEVKVAGYESRVEGYNVTNTLVTPTPSPSASPTVTPNPDTTPTSTTTPEGGITPTPTGTPGTTATPGTTPDVTATPGTTPGTTATPGTTPGITATPGTTPDVTATPGTTPGTTATPGTTPAPGSTPGNTPENTTPVPGSTPENTPEPGVTPEVTIPGPEMTPGNTPGREGQPTPDSRRVLGARREQMSASKGAVLGARRGFEQAVLGRRRRPSTGDSAALLLWIMMDALAAGGTITSTIMLKSGSKNKRKRR